MKEYLLGFLGSIFLITFFGNYLLGGVFLFVFVCMLNKWKVFVLGCIIGISSIVLFLFLNPLGEVNEKEIIGIVSKSLGVGRYELQGGEDTYILTTKKEIPLGSKIKIQSFQYIFPEKIQVFWYKWNIHELIEGGFSYEKRLYIKGYIGDVQYPGAITFLGKESSSYRKLENKIIETYGKGHIGGLLQGMIVGGRRGISKEQYSAFIDSGLVHIIAVSGSNIMMLVVVCSGILFWVPIFWKRFILGGVVIFYLFFCGIDSSIVRATLFALINLVVLYYGARITLERLLCYTLTILLIYNPFLFVYDLGLLLSVSALLGLYFGNKYFSVGVRFIDIYILPSFFATLGVIPVLLIYVGKFNLLSPFYTILLGPFLSPLIIVSIMSLYVDIALLKNVSLFGLSFIYKLASYGQQLGVYIIIESLLVSITVSLCLIVSLYVIRSHLNKSTQ